LAVLVALGFVEKVHPRGGTDDNPGGAVLVLSSAAVVRPMTRRSTSFDNVTAKLDLDRV
jgi:hypothetical protein